MKKIEITELHNIQKHERQIGASGCFIYDAEYDGKSVILKVQEIVRTNNLNQDIFENEKKVYDCHDICHLPVAKCYGWGDDWQGMYASHRYFVLEKLDPLPETLSNELLNKIIVAVNIFKAFAWANNINTWNCHIGHIMLNKHGNPKLIDFNDDAENYDYDGFLKELKNKNEKNTKDES